MRARALCLVPVLLAVWVAPGFAQPRRPDADRVWVHPDIERLRSHRIAILPAVSFVYLPKERAYVEDAWLQRFARSGHHWLPAILCRDRMASTSRRGDSLLSKVGDQVRSRARVDSVSSPWLARLLESQALLCLRIDRWERAGEGGNERIYVDVTATLVDSVGRLLWKVSSVEGVESAYGLPKVGSASAGTPDASAEGYERWRGQGEASARRFSSGRPGEMGMTGQSSSIALDFRIAVERILTRWERLFPASRGRPSAATTH